MRLYQADQITATAYSMDCHRHKLIRYKEFRMQLQDWFSSNRSSAISRQSYFSFTGFQLSTALNSKFCFLPLKLFMAWHLITSVNWSAGNHQLDMCSDPAKELFLRPLVARSSQHLEEEHFVMQPRSSGTICPVTYLALTHSRVLNATLKHIFLNKLLICKYYIF